MFGLEFIAVGLLHFIPAYSYRVQTLQLVDSSKIYIHSLSKDRAPVNQMDFTLIEWEEEKKVKNINCDSRHALNIKIQPIKRPVKYDFLKSQSELKPQSDRGTVKLGQHYGETVFVRGLGGGDFLLTHAWLAKQDVIADIGVACVYVTDIKIVLNYNPEISVAREYSQGTCEFDDIMRHEKKHVNIRLKMLNKYSKILAQRFKKAFDKRNSFGPFKVSDLEIVNQSLDKNIKKIKLSIDEEMLSEISKLDKAFDAAEKGRKLCK